MKLLQYWDTGAPPPQVRPWIEGFSAINPEMTHRLENRRTATALIESALGERHARAFCDCAVPAMQADYFRYCALWSDGGVYLDVDTRPVGPVSGLLEVFPGPLLPVYRGFFNTPVMSFPEPRNPLLAAVLVIATDNIETRRFQNVLPATGPAIADAIRAMLDPDWLAERRINADGFSVNIRFGGLLDVVRSLIRPSEELLAAYRRLAMPDLMQVSPWVDPTPEVDYQSTDRDWRRWKGSIFSDLSTYTPA